MIRVDNTGTKEITSRVKQVMECFNCDIPSFAKKCGLSPSYVSRTLRTGLMPVDWLLLVLKVFPSVSAEWLTRGDGDMILPDAHDALPKSDTAWLKRRFTSLQATYDKEMDAKNEQIASLQRTIENLTASIGETH